MKKHFYLALLAIPIGLLVIFIIARLPSDRIPIDVTDFQAMMEARGLEVVDAMDLADNERMLVFLSAGTAGFRVEYSKYTSNEGAQYMFNHLRRYGRSRAPQEVEEVEFNNRNYDFFQISAGGTYWFTLRIDYMVILAIADVGYGDELQKLITEIDETTRN